MAKSQTTVAIEDAISELGAGAAEQCRELAAHFRHMMNMAGSPVGELALALVGSEMEANIDEGEEAYREHTQPD